MIGCYNYTVVLTYASAFCAVCGIRCAVHGNARAALVLLLVCGLLDMLDGPVARSKKDRSPSDIRYGIQIDSLSDLTAFGILPAAICFSLCEKSAFSMVGGAVFSLAALIRLAFFNVTEEERAASTSEKRKTFTGLPVTAIALILPLFCSFALRLKSSVFSVCAPLLLIVISFFNLLRFTLPKPGKVSMLLMGIAGIAILLLVLFLVP